MLDPQIQLRANIASTWAQMQQRLTAAPCSPAFHDQLRDIAYLPDGLNEFVYAAGGVVKCSVDADVAAYSLGVPDVRTEAPNVSIWYDKPLDFLGRTRLIGTILVRDDLGIIVPPQPIPDVSSSWLSFEVLAVAGDNYRHRAGVTGIFANAKAAGPLAGYLPLHQAAFFSLLCAPNGASCVATKAPLSAVLAEHWPISCSVS